MVITVLRSLSSRMFSWVCSDQRWRTELETMSHESMAFGSVLHMLVLLPNLKPFVILLLQPEGVKN